jgi:Bacterial regulatory helix-turn-helix protein, lysR family
MGACNGAAASALLRRRGRCRGCLTVAAEQKLHTSQPSLSRQIRDFEAEVGVQLINRARMASKAVLREQLKAATSNNLLHAIGRRRRYLDVAFACLLGKGRLMQNIDRRRARISRHVFQAEVGNKTFSSRIRVIFDNSTQAGRQLFLHAKTRKSR